MLLTLNVNAPSLLPSQCCCHLCHLNVTPPLTLLPLKFMATCAESSLVFPRIDKGRRTMWLVGLTGSCEQALILVRSPGGFRRQKWALYSTVYATLCIHRILI
jgi:hypothetical protein